MPHPTLSQNLDDSQNLLYPWQQQDWQALPQRDQLAQACLLTGRAGTGLSQFAQTWAHSLLCEDPKESGLPCQHCQACRWFEADTHPDFQWLTTQCEQTEDKRPRTMPLITIEAVRRTIEPLQLTAHRQGLRVVLISPAEALNLAASNALLKILEDPPLGLIFILATEAPQRLLATLKSRCQQHRLTLPTPSSARSWLDQQGVEHPEQALAYAGGAPLDAGNRLAIEQSRELIAWLTGLNLKRALDCALWVEKQNLALSVPLSFLAKWLHDLACVYYRAPVRYFPEQHTQLSHLSERCNMQKLMRLNEQLSHLRAYDRHPLNVRLQLEALLIGYLRLFI